MPGSWSPGSGNGHLDVLRNASTKDPRYAVDSEESSCVRFESETIPVFFFEVLHALVPHPFRQ